jgi:hypothetical protein
MKNEIRAIVITVVLIVGLFLLVYLGFLIFFTIIRL